MKKIMSGNTSENILGTFDGASWYWHNKRNISISPAQLAIIFAFLGLVSLLIGSVFYWYGASLILPFSVLEIAALLIAYVYNAIHANDYEKLTLTSDAVHIERKIGLKLQQVQWMRSMTRVDKTSLQNQLIELRQGHQLAYFGQFIHVNLRLALAKQISARMISPVI
jgi:uncharacterized membrane protein